MSSERRTQRLRLGRPVWLEHAGRPAPRYPSLSDHVETSVAIVGGGMTGALVAHAFASAGVATVVLERALVGRGSTAASSALLLQEPDLELTELARRYGLRTSRRIWQLSRDSVRGLIALLRRRRIDCDLDVRDAVYYAIDREDAARLRRECAFRTRAGFAAEWLEPAAIRRLTGIAAEGAIRTRRNAQFDPYRACLGVMRAATAEGACVFERSRVLQVRADKDRVRLRTSRGVVTADRVVVATGYATPEFRPLTARFRMYRTYVLGTEPLHAAQRRRLGFADVLVWDAKRPYHYARWTPDHRLLLGGGDRLVRARQRSRLRLDAARCELRAYFEAQLPPLARVEMPFAWEGLFAMTSDSLPYIGPHRRYPRHWFALGYGGNGMTFGFLAARLLLERWQGTRSGDQALFEFGRTRR
jgi:glycine/D-amino acid oxidase-like deaminating enzyme